MRKREYIIADPAKRKNVMKALLHDVGQLPDNKPWVVTIKRLETPISDGQRKLWWVWMQILGDDMGDTKEGVYETIKHDLVSWMQGRGISDLSNEEMHALMEEVQMAASSLGWHLPSSMDDYYLGIESMQAERGKNF
ncbi:MAG: hypothetical protein KDJ47_05880 [Hyphomicrobiaceae bacterium]|nr:hypothetical protein [Hyphomicrobiaceae bacterium]